MGDQVLYAESVSNFTGGQHVNVEVGARDGLVLIRFTPHGADPVACLFEPEEARSVADAIGAALKAIATSATE